MEAGEKKRILIVDDDEGYLEAIRRIFFLDDTYTVVTAKSPDIAFSEYRSYVPHVIISDYMMPGIDGLTFIKQARELWPERVYIMITGNPSLSMSLEALNDLGIFRILVKPFDEDVLLQTVAEGVKYYDYKEKVKQVSLEAREQILRGPASGLIAELKKELVVVSISLQCALKDFSYDRVQGVGDNLLKINEGIENISNKINSWFPVLCEDEVLGKIDAARIVEEINEALRPLCMFSNIKMKVNCSLDLPGVLLSIFLMYQVLVNVYTNIAEVMKSGTIETGVEYDKKLNQVVISVESHPANPGSEAFEMISGTGAEKDVRSFDMGFRISRKVIEDYNGTIDVLKRSAQGELVIIKIPA